MFESTSYASVVSAGTASMSVPGVYIGDVVNASSSVVVADFNRDGIPDIVVASLSGSKLFLANTSSPGEPMLFAVGVPPLLFARRC